VLSATVGSLETFPKVEPLCGRHELVYIIPMIQTNAILLHHIS